MRNYKKDHQNARRIRFGWRISPSGHHMIDKEQQKTIIRILNMRNRGLILQEICDVLNQEGVATPRNGKWHCSTIKKIIDQNLHSYIAKK